VVRLHDPSKLPRPVHRAGYAFDSGIAVNDAVAPESSWRVGSRVFPARLKGRCPCGESFEPGDRVHYITRNVLAHEGCDGTETPPLPQAEQVMAMGPAQVRAARARMCPRCFQERLPSGACGNCDA
jgi:hypothetical protein